jgi:acetyl-CoA synthetase
MPFFGILPEVVDDKGSAAPKNCGGKLVIRKPWRGSRFRRNHGPL